MLNNCKYCSTLVVDLTNYGLQCDSCNKYVHTTCLKRGSTPGALMGDVFFTFTCLECSETNLEIFTREDQRWFNVILLALYHLNIQNKALSRKGYFHWKMHVATFIDKNWEIMFGKHVKQRKNWMGTISGVLSVHSPAYFQKSAAISDQGWWALTRPKLPPKVVVNLASEVSALKASLKSQNILKPDYELLDEVLEAKEFDPQYTAVTQDCYDLESEATQPPSSPPIPVLEPQVLPTRTKQKRSLLPTLETFTSHNHLFEDYATPPRKKQRTEIVAQEDTTSLSQGSSDSGKLSAEPEEPTLKILDPMCHYNTSLNNLSSLKRMNLKVKLTGGLREEPLLSPYSNLYLKPFIHRDVKNTPLWLKLMAQIQLKANKGVKNYKLPARWPIDYVYIQPSHIPAINSLCNQYFWPGIDLTETLQYPDFTCVVMYKKLIVGFAVIVPDVKFHENYISFLFVRPGWRNIGIAKFMIYHLIQTSMGKDITLHVAVNNPALFLYQKFGFKVEHVELNFYEKYLREDSFESVHAFFCRLER